MTTVSVWFYLVRTVTFIKTKTKYTKARKREADNANCKSTENLYLSHAHDVKVDIINITMHVRCILYRLMFLKRSKIVYAKASIASKEIYLKQWPWFHLLSSSIKTIVEICRHLYGLDLTCADEILTRKTGINSQRSKKDTKLFDLGKQTINFQLNDPHLLLGKSLNYNNCYCKYNDQKLFTGFTKDLLLIPGLKIMFVHFY